MSRTRRTVSVRVLGTIAAAALLLAGCGTGGKADRDAAAAEQAAAGAKRDLSFTVVVHSVPDGAFWNVVKKGALDAGRQFGVDVEVLGDPEGSKQAQLIQSAIAKKPNGIVVSMANPDALKSALGDVTAAGIPFITINSGAERSKEFGALMHFGQSEEVAGEAAGARMKESGVTKLVCLIHEAGNTGLEQRCAGAAKGFGGQIENLQVQVANPQEIQATVKSKLLGDPSVDGILSLNPAVTTAAVAGVKESGKPIKVGSFDIDDGVLKAITDGDVLFTVDQQQYLQGYLPIVMLVLHHDNGSTLGGGMPVLTGPAFITKENVAAVAGFVKDGTR
ncbi:MAG: sugar ABC transporter substrate-binding protein [Dermatophilaceae bacterium]